MAGARAAMSLSLTIGVAFATLLVTGGILAGPAIVDCSHNPDGFGACLRGKIVQSGLLPAEAAPAPMPVLSSEPSSTESAPPIVAETPAPRPGWMAANATEYEPPSPSIAALSGEPGQVDVNGTAPAATAAAAKIALAQPPGRMQVDGAAAALAEPGAASLAPELGSIDASGTGLPGSRASGRTASQPAPTGQPAASGQVGRNAMGSGHAALAATLVADLSPAPPLAEIVDPPQRPTPKFIPHRAAAPSKSAVLPAPKATPGPLIKYDPRYPSVIVLPPPNRGKNSSFATLEVR